MDSPSPYLPHGLWDMGLVNKAFSPHGIKTVSDIFFCTLIIFVVIYLFLICMESVWCFGTVEVGDLTFFPYVKIQLL